MRTYSLKVRWLDMRYRLFSGRGEFESVAISLATFEIENSTSKSGEKPLLHLISNEVMLFGDRMDARSKASLQGAHEFLDNQPYHVPSAF